MSSKNLNENSSHFLNLKFSYFRDYFDLFSSLIFDSGSLLLSLLFNIFFFLSLIIIDFKTVNKLIGAVAARDFNKPPGIDPCKSNLYDY